MPYNPNCDGGHCRYNDGDVRIYPLGSGGNLILCRACWEHENAFRRDRGNQAWPLVNWDTAGRYPDDEPDEFDAENDQRKRDAKEGF